MEQQLLDKYGGRNLNKKLLKQILKNIDNYENPIPIKTIIQPNLNLDNILTQIDTMKDVRGDDLTDKTKSNYKSKIKAIEKIIPNIFQLFIDNPNNNSVINNIFKLIVKQYPKSYKDYIVPLSKIINNLEGLDDNISPYIKSRIQQVIKEGNKVSQKISDDNVEFKPLKITWQDYVRKTGEVIRNEKIPLQIQLLFLLYKILPLRDNFGNVRITDKDLENNTNFYNINTRFFHLNNYKTKKTFGRKKYQLPTYLNQMIKKLFEDQNYLFVQLLPDTIYKNGELSKVVSKLTNKYYGVQFNITDIRNARISYSQENESIDNQRKTASLMLHSLSMANQVYNRKKKI